MFTILVKDFNGRIVERYFKDWNNAKNVMDSEVQDALTNRGGCLKSQSDFFNDAKGFYEYSATLHFAEVGEDCTWFLTEGHFED
jgi:hypothetical protein